MAKDMLETRPKSRRKTDWRWPIVAAICFATHPGCELPPTLDDPTGNETEQADDVDDQGADELHTDRGSHTSFVGCSRLRWWIRDLVRAKADL